LTDLGTVGPSVAGHPQKTKAVPSNAAALAIEYFPIETTPKSMNSGPPCELGSACTAGGGAMIRSPLCVLIADCSERNRPAGKRRGCGEIRQRGNK
jgi:hypothetical protein